MTTPMQHVGNQPPEHRQLRPLLRRGWPAIVIGVLAGLAVAAVLTVLATARYTASASVLVTATGVSDSATLANGRTSGVINMDTEVQLATSADVARRVRRTDPATRSMPLSEFIKQVQVSVPANTEVLNISYNATSPTTAAQRANEFATAYLNQRQADAQSTLEGQVQKASADLTTLTDHLKSASATLAKLPKKSSQVNFVKAQRAVIVNQINAVTGQLTTLATTVVTPGKVLTNATPPGSPSSPSRVLNLSAGAAGGFLLGLLAAWVSVVLTRRLRRPDEVGAQLGLPVLGVISTAGGAPVAPADSPAFEEYRRLANVVTTTLGARPGVVLVTGQCAPTAAVAFAGNLARAMLLSGARTEVATAVVDGPGLWRRLFGADRALGPTLAAIPNPGLDARSLAAVRGDGYLIVVASDPQGSADPQTVATRSDGVLVLVEAKSRAADTKAVLAQLDAVGAPLLGAVLVPSASWWERATKPEAAKADFRRDGGRSPFQLQDSTELPSRPTQRAGVPAGPTSKSTT